MTNRKLQWNDGDPALAAFHGFKILEKLGIPKDQMIESATIEIVGGNMIKLNTVFVLSVKQLKEMGIDLDA